MDGGNRKISDYFAELYVAGRLADADWNVYFPHRDIGFDFIIAKKVGERMIIRPVQVKGRYPSGDKTDKPTYGYVGKLSEVHSEMVLAIAYFSSDQGSPPLSVWPMSLACWSGSIPVATAVSPLRLRADSQDRAETTRSSSIARAFGAWNQKIGRIQHLFEKGLGHVDTGTDD